MSNSPTDLSDTNGVSFRSTETSQVYARGDLISYAQAIDDDFDLIISLKADWNSFFKNVALPSPSGDDVEGADNDGTHDVSGSNYYDFSMASGNIKRPRAVLQTAMDVYDNSTGELPADGNADLSGVNGDAIYWASAVDYNTDNDVNGVPASHLQSVAKGLIGLFSTSAEIETVGDTNMIVEERDESDNTIAAADAQYEIRIDRTNLLAWMSQNGSYGQNVMTQDQLEELMEAAAHGRYITELSGQTLSRSADLEGHRVLALRQGDCLQVRIRVHDNIGVATGSEVNRDNGNHRDWLLSFEQSTTNAFQESTGTYVSA